MDGTGAMMVGEVVESEAVISSVADVFQLAVICVLIVFSGVFSGLNLGLMSLTLNDLTVCVVCLCCSISLSLSL
jgi:hypothetical protein